MENQSLSETQKLQELAQFFEIFKFKVFPGFSAGKDALHVIDHRGEDWSMLITLRLGKNGDTFIVDEFTFTSPLIQVSYLDKLILVELDPNTKKEKVRIEWGNVSPVEEQINPFTLKMLVEHPAFYIVYTFLMMHKEIDIKYEHDIVNRLWDYKVDLDTEGLEVVEYFAQKFK